MIESESLDNRAEVLTDRQRTVLSEIERYVAAYHEPPSIRFLARRMGLHHKTIQEHLDRLNRKGWLRASQPTHPCHN